MKIRSVFALCVAMLVSSFTFAADLVSDYTISEDSTTYTRSEGWSVSNGATIIFKYANLPQTGTERLVSWSQSNKDQVGAVGLCSYSGLLKGYWQDGYWASGTINTTALGTSGLIVCVYGPNTDGVTAYNAEGTVIFRASGLRATGTGATMGTRFDFSTCVTDVAIYNAATAAEDIAAIVEEFTAEPVVPETGALPENMDFAWTPGSAPTGWFTGWGGEAAGNPIIKMIGPSGTISEVYRVHNDGNANNQKWHPYNAMTAKSAYTLSLYGCVDMIETPEEGKYAVLWAMGGSPRTVLAMDSNRKIVLLKAVGGGSNPSTDATISQSIVAHAIKGYHLITVTFDSEKGASLTIDAEDPKESSEFKAVSGAGIQFGSIYGGCPKNFTLGRGLVILGAYGYDAPISKEAITTLAAQYPAVETLDKTIAIDAYGESIYLPSITIPDGKQLRVQKGTLIVPAAVEATLGALEFGDINSGDLGFGMELDGTINIVNDKVFTNNDEGTAYDACNNGRGVNFGEWAGEGVFTIRGTFNASETVVVVVHDSSKVTINVDGGMVNVMGITAKYPDRATIKLANDATFIYSEKVSDGKSVTLSEEGEYSITSDSGAYKLVRAADEDYVFTESTTVESVLSGKVSVIVNPGEDGVVTFTKANTFTGGLVVESGTAKTTSATGFGPNNYNSWATPDALGQIEVKDGATLDLANTKDTCYAITTAGTITNSGNDIGTTNRQTVKIALSGDATVSGNTFGLLAPNNNATTLDLGEHTLTVAMNEGKMFLLSNTTISGMGTIKLKSGSLWINQNKSLTGTIKLDLSEFPTDGGTVATGSAAQLAKIGLAEGQTGWSLVADGTTLMASYSNPIVKIGDTIYDTLEEALAHLTDGAVVTILKEEVVSIQDFTDRAVTLTDNEDGTYTATLDKTDEIALRFSEIMPKPSDKPNSITTESGYDKNGLESGWVELENTSDKWADLGDYKFIRTNRSKANDKGDYGAFPSVMIPPRSKYVFYTSERYSNSASKADSAFAEGTFDGKPKYFEKYDMMIWGDKINPKKFPFVRLYYKDTTIVDTVVIPSDIPEGNSIIITPVEEGKSTVRYMTNKPTKGADNTALTDASIVELGPNAGPLYEISTGKKHNSASEFARVAAPATAGVDYEITFSMNPTMSPTEVAKFRAEDAITKIDMIVRTDLDDETLTTIPVELTTKTTDSKDWGDSYTATIPSTLFPAAGHLIQWKFKVTDAAGKTWTTPSFHNPDDGYEWYGTIVESEALTSKTLPTWHMFVDAASKAQMDIDTDKQDLSVVPYNARVAIYDSSTSNYYDYVRIDLRGNTSANFKKKSHGLRFSKAHPLTMWDPVAGEMREEVRKSSLIGEPADPSRMRQMMAFWLWNKMGNKVPFDFPVRCNLNGEFFQLGFHSERFTDELIEDFHKLDKYGYGYKNVGTLASGSGTTAGGIEKKTPDDGNESDITVLQNELRAPLKSRGIDTLNASNNEELPAVTKFVVEKFDLPAWLNYLASARITQEMDDVWANISIYYDDAQMLEGTRGTGTWMPLGYDFNLTFGQWYINDVQGATRNGMYMVNQDWFKSHPFYGGNVVRCYKQEAMTSMCNEGNRAIEAVWQSPKFRRLYLRRLRTLMDQELGAPNEDETFENTTIPVMVKMKEVADLMRADANKDTTTYPWDSTISNIDIWGSSLFPKTMDDGIAEIWEKYIVPRRQHLYVTHAAEGHDADKIGYGTTLCAGIPSGQSPIGELKGGISAEYDATIGATIIKNTNDEVIDLSDWMLGGPVSMTLPAGTVIDAGTAEAPAEVYITANRRATIAQMTLVDQVVVGNGTAGTADLAITLSAADGTEVISAPTDQSLYVRLWGFTGAPKLADEDWGEAIVLTNLNQSAAIDLGGMDINFCGSDKLDTASKCHFVLIEGVTIPAGGFIRIKKTDTTLFTVATAWDKIANHGQRITIKDKNGTIVQFFELVDQDALGVYLTGLGLKYDYETSAWETISEQESPGWEDLTPPPPPPEEGEGDEETYPEDATEYTGEYPDTVTIPGGNVLFNGATFAAGLTIAADTTIYLKAGTENSASTITSLGAMTIDGSGTLTINYADGEIGTAAVTFTTELPCYYIQNKGTVNLNLSSTNQVFGFYAKDLKNVVARFNGGVFNATIQGGDSSAAFKFNKGSNDLIINGTEINIALGGAAPRFANVGGHIEFTKDCGKVNVSTITGEGTNARVFKSDKKVKIYGGVILGEASGEGSEIFSAGAEVNVTGGVVNVTAADDCFSAATLISVAGGIIHAVSEAGDALDSNGSMSITGGHVFAFTKSGEHEALDVMPSTADELTHTLTIDAGATVVTVSGKTPEVEPTGTATFFTKSFESVSNKFVGFTTVTKTDTLVITRNYALSWEDKIAASPTILIAGSGLTDAKADVKNPGKDNPDYVALDENIAKLTVKTSEVENIKPSGATTWDEVEVSESTTVEELVGVEQAATLSKFTEVTPLTIATWAKTYSSSTKPGKAIDLVAFALNCAPNEEAIDAAKKNFKVTITMTEEGPVAEIESGFYNVTPVLKGKVELPEENWIEVTKDNKDTLKFFRAFIEIGE